MARKKLNDLKKICLHNIHTKYVKQLIASEFECIVLGMIFTKINVFLGMSEWLRLNEYAASTYSIEPE